MIKWLLIPENSALLNGLGFIVGLLGLLLSLVGFWVAWKQLRAIRTETEASNAAIKSVQVKVAAFDTAQECQTASVLIRGIRDHLGSENWQSVVTGYEHLIQSFLRLSHSNSSIQEDDRMLLHKMTTDMARICEGIRKKLSDRPAIIVLKGQDQALRDFSDIMTKITFAVAKDLQQ